MTAGLLLGGMTAIVSIVKNIRSCVKANKKIKKFLSDAEARAVRITKSSKKLEFLAEIQAANIDEFCRIVLEIESAKRELKAIHDDLLSKCMSKRLTSASDIAASLESVCSRLC